MLARSRKGKEEERQQIVEPTITVELSATEGIHVVNAISARLEALEKQELTLEVLYETKALHSFIMKIEPQVLGMAAQEKAKADQDATEF